MNWLIERRCSPTRRQGSKPISTMLGSKIFARVAGSPPRGVIDFGSLPEGQRFKQGLTEEIKILESLRNSITRDSVVADNWREDLDEDITLSKKML